MRDETGVARDKFIGRYLSNEEGERTSYFEFYRWLNVNWRRSNRNVHTLKRQPKKNKKKKKYY